MHLHSPSVPSSAPVSKGNTDTRPIYALRLLGETAVQRHPPDITQAEAYYQQALALAEELGMHPLQAHCHRGLGTLYTRTAGTGPC